MPPFQIAQWATPDDDGALRVDGGVRAIQMANSDGTGSPLVKNNTFGADVIRFGPGEGVVNHTHVGAHILFVIKGDGVVEYEGVEHALRPGLCYMIPSMVRHAIRAKSDLVLIAVGDDHRDLASVERMDVAE